MKLLAIASAWLKPRAVRLPDHNGTGITITESGKAMAANSLVEQAAQNLPRWPDSVVLKKMDQVAQRAFIRAICRCPAEMRPNPFADRAQRDIFCFRIGME